MDRTPFAWALAVAALLAGIAGALQFLGTQRLANSAFWQRWHPVVARSAAQTATPVEVVSQRRLEHVVVQTEKGLYFLTGDDFVPAAGERVVVEQNDAWALFLCDEAGARCATIHSFCAERVWPDVRRDAEGRVEGCYAPHLGGGSNAAVTAITEPPPDRAGGPGGRRQVVPAMGMSHPREWAWRMGLPKAAP